MSETSFTDAQLKSSMKTVLTAAGITGAKAEPYLSEQVGVVDLIGRLAREANIASLGAYDTLADTPDLLPDLKGERRLQKFNKPETFTRDELREIGKFLGNAREENKDKPLPPPQLLRLKRHATSGKFAGPGAGMLNFSYEEEPEDRKAPKRSR